MPDRFATLIGKHEEPIIRSFADEIYNDRQTDLPLSLSYEQLINFLPDFLDDLARLLDTKASDDEMFEAARRLRSHAQVRFHQGVLLDEVARELTVFRRVFSDFLCREGSDGKQEDASEMCSALCLANRFVDELIVQAMVVYAASMRPPVKTRNSIWPPPRRRKSDFVENGGEPQ
ncbi:MAG: RsbRD N-terminal domain-containing protein [Pyrinomonadaceae bacterium]